MLRDKSRLFLVGAMAATALAVGLGGCGGGSGGEAESTSSADAMAERAPAPSAQLNAPDQDFSGRGVRTSDALAAVTAPGIPAPPPPQDNAQPGSMLIRNGNVSIRVDSLEPAMDAVRRLATDLGGFVGNVSVSTGDYEVRSATLQLRVPSNRFDDAMGGMAPLGKVEHSSTTVLDVGEEHVDITTRIANAKRLEARLVQLLASRTGSLEDVLAVERELARVREDIERREARLRFLDSRVALSTIDVTVSERGPVVGSSPGRSVIGQAFVGAWRNFVGLVAFLIESLGVIIPLVLVIWAALRLFRRRRRHYPGQA